MGVEVHNGQQAKSLSYWRARQGKKKSEILSSVKQPIAAHMKKSYTIPRLTPC